MKSLERVDAVQSLWRVRHALRGLQDAFATDRFAMEVVSLRDDRLRIAIRALDGACAECLIAADVIRDLIRTQIPSDLGSCVIDVHLDVPDEWGFNHGGQGLGATAISRV